MKKTVWLSVTLAAVLFSGCGPSDSVKAPSSGRAYELFVVAPTDLWESAAGDTVRSIFSREVEMVNQPEPLFDLLSVPPANFRKTVARHRNILILRTGAQYERSDMTAAYDVYSAPQLQVTVTSPSADSMAAFLHTYGHELEQFYEIVERNRFVAQARAHRDPEIGELIREKFGFDISIPSNYRVRIDTTNFLWVSYELPLASVGFLIYTYPADTAGGPAEAPGRIIAARNGAARLVPGPSKGSYMSTSTVIRPDRQTLTIGGRRWTQMRGFWDVTGDFMGGPFINYTTCDPANGRMIAIDGYVYSPSPNNQIPMRNYIRQIEAIFRTVRIPE